MSITRCYLAACVNGYDPLAATLALSGSPTCTWAATPAALQLQHMQHHTHHPAGCNKGDYWRRHSPLFTITDGATPTEAVRKQLRCYCKPHTCDICAAAPYNNYRHLTTLPPTPFSCSCWRGAAWVQPRRVFGAAALPALAGAAPPLRELRTDARRALAGCGNPPPWGPASSPSPAAAGCCTAGTRRSSAPCC